MFFKNKKLSIKPCWPKLIINIHTIHLFISNDTKSTIEHFIFITSDADSSIRRSIFAAECIYISLVEMPTRTFINVPKMKNKTTISKNSKVKPFKKSIQMFM